jgi:hypothetical protein
MNDNRLLEGAVSIAEAPNSVTPAMAQEYPSTFAPDLIRWIPVYVPLMGLLLTPTEN